VREATTSLAGAITRSRQIQPALATLQPGFPAKYGWTIPSIKITIPKSQTENESYDGHRKINKY
jgi:hypothetical protein